MLTVLVVDDEPVVRRALKILLSGSLEDSEAGSAGEVLELIRSGKSIDAVVSDGLMPRR